MAEIILKKESYTLVGICMEIHSELGMGFREIVYKDTLEYEFKSRGIPYVREKPYKIKYKSIILPHAYNADFIVYDSIILEVKAMSMVANNFVTQTINYLKASGLQLGIIANFGQKSLCQKE
jgi:GxxExxY protein